MVQRLPGILEYLEACGDGLDDVFARFAAHEQRIGGRLLDYLDSRSDVRIVGRRDPAREHRVPTIAFTVQGKQVSEISEQCAKDRVGISHGDFYAARAIDAMGLREHGGVIRASMVHYNTVEDVDRLIGSLDRALAS